MAVMRQNIKCEICECAYSIRVWIGHQEERWFTYKCMECQQPITLKLLIDQKAVTAKIELFENCMPGTDDGIIYNLHPDYVIPSSQLHEPTYFPLDQNMHILNRCKKFILKAQKKQSNFIDFYEAFSFGVDLPSQYRMRQRQYDFYKINRPDLVKVHCGEIKKLTDRSYHKVKAINDFIDIALALLEPNKLTRYISVKRFYNRRLEKRESQHLRSFVKTQFIELLPKYLAALDYFWRSYNELAKVCTYVRANVTIPPASISASLDFDLMKNLYGNAYEIMMDIAIIPAVFNNAYRGRSYDIFEKMTLNKYIKTDKAGRMKCFENTDQLTHLTENVDSKLRNSSHHENMTIEFSTGREKIIYKSGRPLKEYSIEYIEYLEKTTKLLFDIFALFAAHAMNIK